MRTAKLVLSHAVSSVLRPPTVLEIIDAALREFWKVDEGKLERDSALNLSRQGKIALGQCVADRIGLEGRKITLPAEEVAAAKTIGEFEAVINSQLRSAEEKKD